MNLDLGVALTMTKCEQLRIALFNWGGDKYLPLLKENEALIKENQRLRLQNRRLYQKNKSISERLARLDGEIVLKESNKKQYVLYKEKTDEILFVGDVQQCSNYLGITTDSFKWKMTPAAQKRPHSITIIDADEIDKVEAKERNEDDGIY